MMETKLVLLGTGTPNACPNASGPSSAVVVGDRAYLVDFGPGVVRQAAKAYQQGIDALLPGPADDRILHTSAHRPHGRLSGSHFYPVGAGTPEAAESIRSKRHPEHDRTYFKSI